MANLLLEQIGEVLFDCCNVLVQLFRFLRQARHLRLVTIFLLVLSVQQAVVCLKLVAKGSSDSAQRANDLQADNGSSVTEGSDVVPVILLVKLFLIDQLHLSLL